MPEEAQTAVADAQLVFQCRHTFAAGFSLDASFEAGPGVTALFGPSGAGKSTLLAVLAGILTPTAGHIRLLGRTLLDTARGIRRPPQARGIGVVFQEHRLFPHLSVARNLEYGARRIGSRGGDVRRCEFQRVVEILELGDVLDRLPRTLSGGQQQRTALGRALLCGPQLLLMDEPLVALDAALKDRILTYLERVLAEWHIPTLLVSHDQADVRRLAQRVVVLEAGRVIAAGPTAETLDRAMLTLLKSPGTPINLLRVREVKPAGEHWEGQIGGHPFHLPGGVRPVDGSLLIRFLPSDVTLSRGPIAGLSIRNQLPARVQEIVKLEGRLLVALDVGERIWAEITPEAAAELELQPGAQVTCLIKSTAVHPVA